jgi:hypothetical protein
MEKTRTVPKCARFDKRLGFLLSFRAESVFNLWPFKPTILPRVTARS